AFANNASNLTSDGEPERVLGARAEAELFKVLGARPLLGRLYTKNEELAGKADVWVIGWSLWQRRYGGSRDVLGKRNRDGRAARHDHWGDATGFQVSHQRKRVLVTARGQRGREASCGVLATDGGAS